MHAVVQTSTHDLAGIVGDVECWLAELAITDSTITTVPDLARDLDVSTRTVNRLTTKYVGLPPYAMIRRRRLQEAVESIRNNPDEPLADIAVRFGFVDQAHLSREANALLGLTLTTYRQRACRQ